MLFSKNKRDHDLEIGKQFPIGRCVNQVFKVLSFDDNGSVIDNDSMVKAKSRFKPYGYLSVVNPIIVIPHNLRIIHRDDFLLATQSFEYPDVVNSSAELLVCYSPYLPNKQGYSTSAHHVLHFALAPLGTLDYYFSLSNPEPKLLFGRLNYTGELSVKDLIS